MNLRLASAGFALISTLSGCAAPPEYVKVEDPFKASLTTNRLQANAKVCFLVTENTLKTFEYVDAINKGLAGALGGNFDSKRLVSDFAGTLQSRFRDAVRIASTSELQPRGCDLALAADLRLTMSPGPRKTASAAISVSFADGAGTRLDSVEARGEGADWNSMGAAGAAAWSDALQKLVAGMDGSRPLIAFVNGLAKPGSATASSSSIELAFWDSVKESRNPADLRAYLDKFPNGSFSSLARSRIVALGEPAPLPSRPVAFPGGVGSFNFGRYHALVIGIDDYKAVTKLKTAVNDARAVAGLLRDSYGFSVRLLLDPTRNQMLDAFDELRREMKQEDNLIIYYAGHGYLDADTDRGFWLPADADRNRRANWLSNSDVADTVRAIRAKHVMVVADSCYAGTLTRNLSVETSGLDDLSRLSQKKARTALVSGGLEPVEDAGGQGHSVFAAAFLDALRSNTGVADMSALFSSIRRRVLVAAQQTPQYGDIRQTGHEGGDFIFVKQK